MTPVSVPLLHLCPCYNTTTPIPEPKLISELGQQLTHFKQSLVLGKANTYPLRANSAQYFIIFLLRVASASVGDWPSAITDSSVPNT